MKRFEFWKLGLQNVMAATLRSCLTVLGMAIGVAAILAVITLGDAGKSQVKSEISRLGIDRVTVTAEGGGALSRQDGEYLNAALETQVDGLTALPVEIRFGVQAQQAVVIGCEQSYFDKMTPELSGGRELLPAEWLSGSRAALVGEALANQLRLHPGEWFSAGGMMLCCTGVLGSSASAARIDIQQAVIVPAAVLEPWLGNELHELTVYVPQGQSPDEIARKAEKVLYDERSLEVEAVSLQVQAEAADSVMTVFIDVLRWVALICMLVGGIGVTNILLVSVRERRREIGVMQSLGATGPQICGLFLCEALIYAVSGGILGLLMGGVLIAVAGGSIGLTPVVRAWDCTVVFTAAVALGLLSGVAPAAQACMLKPVDALRDD